MLIIFIAWTISHYPTSGTGNLLTCRPPLSRWSQALWLHGLLTLLSLPKLSFSSKPQPSGSAAVEVPPSLTYRSVARLQPFQDCASDPRGRSRSDRRILRIRRPSLRQTDLSFRSKHSLHSSLQHLQTSKTLQRSHLQIKSLDWWCCRCYRSHSIASFHCCLYQTDTWYSDQAWMEKKLCS